jgi:hypothetical protein
VDHTNHYEQAAKDLRCAKRHVYQNCPDDVCREHNWHKHHLCMKQEEDQSSSIDYIVLTNSFDSFFQGKKKHLDSRSVFDFLTFVLE